MRGEQHQHQREAGKAREPGRDHETERFIPPDDQPQTRCERFVLLDGREGLLTAAAEHGGYQCRGERDTRRDLENRRAAVEGNGEECGSRNSGNSVRTAGKRRRFKQEELENLGEDKGDENEVDAALPQNEYAERHCDKRGNQEAREAEKQHIGTPAFATSAAAKPPIAMKAGTAKVSRFMRSITKTLSAAIVAIRI